jgi:hypothetical protein
MNRRPGEERIHIELRADEIPAVLADLATGWNPSPAALDLWHLLNRARLEFEDGREAG